MEGGRSFTISEEYILLESYRIFLPSESNRMQAGRKWRDERLCSDDRGAKGLRHEDIYPLRSELSTPVRSNKAKTTKPPPSPGTTEAPPKFSNLFSLFLIFSKLLSQLRLCRQGGNSWRRSSFRSSLNIRFRLQSERENKQKNEVL